MATPWVNRVVEMRHWEGCGRMRVIRVEGSWAGCEPIDPDTTTHTIGKATEDGLLWFRTRDLQECPPQKESLL